MDTERGTGQLRALAATGILGCLRHRGASSSTEVLLPSAQCWEAAAGAPSCYALPNQDEGDGEIFSQQVGEDSRELDLDLRGDLDLAGICWKYKTARRKQSGRFLECMEENFLMQLQREPSREGALLGLFLVNSGGLVGDVKAGGYLGPSDQEFRIFDSGASKERG